MKTFKAAIVLLTLTASQAFATTAVLCGNPVLVDEDNNKATIHLIFDNSDSRSANEVRASSKGKELTVVSVKEVNQKISIQLAKNKGSIVLSSKYIDSSICESYSDEDTFTLQVKSLTKSSIVKNCRCFQD